MRLACESATFQFSLRFNCVFKAQISEGVSSVFVNCAKVMSNAVVVLTLGKSITSS